MGGEAHKTQFHFGNGGPGSPEPRLPEPSDGVGVWGLVLHMVLMIPLVPATIIDALVTVSTAVYFVRALGSPLHGTVVSSGAAPTSALLLAVFLVIMIAGLGLLVWVLTLLARVVLDRRRWQMVLAAALGIVVLGGAVWAFGDTGLPAAAAVFAVFVYVALVAAGHVQWARRVVRLTP